eukprot:5256487-Karenia_brevis.AAC.1
MMMMMMTMMMRMMMILMMIDDDDDDDDDDDGVCIFMMSCHLPCMYAGGARGAQCQPTQAARLWQQGLCCTAQHLPLPRIDH